MDFWIGDQVKIVSTGIIGIFEGESSDGKAKIKLGSQHVEISLDDIKLYEEMSTDEPSLDLNLEEDPNTNARLHFHAEIDLHIESLDPSRIHDEPNHIRDFQIKQCEAFIRQAIKVSAPQIKIIHGKGTGALKTEVLHLLSGIPEVFIIQETHNGGAQECIMNYRNR